MFSDVSVLLCGVLSSCGLSGILTSITLRGPRSLIKVRSYEDEIKLNFFEFFENCIATRPVLVLEY
jgi:hypothetical protein